MARSVAQTLIIGGLRRSISAKSMSPSFRLLPYRTQSNQSSSSNADPLIRKLEDAIHFIIVRRSAPDWLPFLPGASYWVPPTSSPSTGLAHLLHNLSNPMSPDESMSLTTLRGWPSSFYFIHDTNARHVPVLLSRCAAQHPVEMETTSNCDSHSEDEEEC